MRPWKAGLAAAALIVLASIASAGNQELKNYTLFGGSNTDSAEQVSPWIPIRGANRVVIRTWTAKAAFHASTDADSIYSDSITVWRVAFSDSMLRTNPLAAGDSVIFTAPFADTLLKLVAGQHFPINRALRGPGNGSGIYSMVYATAPASIGAYGDGSLDPQYMRIYVTPLRRNTVTGGNSTEGKRVVGLKGLRMVATVSFNNK